MSASTTGDIRYLCPRCKLHWKKIFMERERGSWTLQWLLRCPECRLVDYPDEDGPRPFGRPVGVKDGRYVKGGKRAG